MARGDVRPGLGLKSPPWTVAEWLSSEMCHTGAVEKQKNIGQRKRATDNGYMAQGIVNTHE